jgi:ATP-dependent helicase/nuclease subunit B
VAVRFVLGRAGSGKTHRCREAIRAHLRADPVNGPDLVLFIPEQAAVQAERALLGVGDLCGASRYHTLSFRRLQHIIMQQAGLADREAVGQIGRQMIVQYLLLQNRPRLHVLQKVADRPGTAAKVAAGLVEFMEQGLLASHLLQTADRIADSRPRSPEPGPLNPTPNTRHPTPDTRHPMLDARCSMPDARYPTPDTRHPPAVPPGLLAGKLRDLALLYDEYLRWLNEHQQADPAALLAAAAEQVGQVDWLRGSLVWVDGFASFSVQQRYTLAKLAQVAGQVEIGLLLDPRIIECDQPPQPHDLFYRTWQTYQQLRASFEQAGVPIGEPVLLAGTSAAPPTRFKDAPMLAHVEEQLFETNPRVKAPTSDRPEIELIAAPDRRGEVEAAARKIIDLTRGAPPNEALRYRQIGVIVRDLEPYHELFQTIFAAHGIPCFIDRRRGVSHHPLVECVRALLRLLTDRWSIDAVASLLKTGLTPMPQTRADLVENYLLAHGIEGWDIWCKGDWAYLRRLVGADEDPVEPSPLETEVLAKVNRARRVLCGLLSDWAGSPTEVPQTGRDWAERLYKVLERLEVPRRLARWQRLAAGGDPAGQELGQQHVRVWSLLVQLLDDLVAGLGEQNMNADQFEATIEAGLEAFSLPLIPPVVDQVVIGSVERGRQGEIVAAFVLGFNEGLFPHRAGRDALLSDHERDRLGQVSAGIDLPTGRQRLFDERLLAYIALTRASRYVWLSYAAADESGKELAPSPYLRALERVLPDMAVRRLADPLADLHVADVGTAWQAATGIVLAGRSVAGDDGRKRDAAWQHSWGSLWKWMQSEPSLLWRVRRVASACDYSNSCTVRADQAGRLGGGALVCSVSHLQEYAACPYRYFARYGLRLEERPEFELAAVELGSFYHRILYKLATRVRQRGQSLRTIHRELLDQLVNEATDEELAAVVAELALPGGREQYLLQRAKTDIRAAFRGHVSLWRRSLFEPAALEVCFGMKGGWPALEIDTPKGRRAILRGKIDRVDVAASGDGGHVLAVIDYKRSSRYKFRLNAALAGLEVQLIAYLKAAQQAASSAKFGAGPVALGGMYYFNILPDWQKVGPDELRQPDTPAGGKQWQLKGLTNSDWLKAFRDGRDPADEQDGAWPVEMRVTRNGEPHANAPAARTADFQKLIDCVWEELGRMVDEILDGHFDVRPYKMGEETACAFCPYDDVCRFAPEFNPYRAIERRGSMREWMQTGEE